MFGDGWRDFVFFFFRFNMLELYPSGSNRRQLHEEWLEKERVAQEEFRLKREREEAALKRKEEEEVNDIPATFIRLWLMPSSVLCPGQVYSLFMAVTLYGNI